MIDIKGLRNDFFCIIIYDIGEKRVNKVNKLLKEYLFHKQNSVFMGNLEKSEFIRILHTLSQIIVEDEDEICFFISKKESDLKEIKLGNRNTGRINSEDDIFL